MPYADGTILRSKRTDILWQVLGFETTLYTPGQYTLVPVVEDGGDGEELLRELAPVYKVFRDLKDVEEFFEEVG